MESDTSGSDAPVTLGADNASAENEPANKPAIDPDDFDAVPSEVTDILGRKRANAIPHPRVKTMIEKATRKQIAEVAKELGIDKADVTMDDVRASLTERNTKYSTYEQQVQQISALEQIAANEPERYIQMLAQVNPEGYGRFAAVLQAQGQQAPQPQHQQAPVADNDPMPEPDYDLGNGQRTYTLDGIEKRMAWERKQAAKEIEARLGERIKPFEQEREALVQRRKSEAIKEQAATTVKSQLEQAQKWHGFKEHAADIEAAYMADKSLTLKDAYIQVLNAKIIPSMAADRTKMRQDLIAEQNSQPRSTSATSTASAVKPGSGPKSTADIARDVMRELSS